MLKHLNTEQSYVTTIKLLLLNDVPDQTLVLELYDLTDMTKKTSYGAETAQRQTLTNTIYRICSPNGIYY